MGFVGSLIRTSVGRKAIMAVSGLLLCAFLVVHLLGNLTLLLNDNGTVTLTPGGTQSSEWFVWVAHHYDAVGVLFFVGEVLLLALFALHIVMGVTLWLQNGAARGGRYVVQRPEGGRSLASATMPYTGLCVILVFLILHLVNFRFGDQDNPQELYLLVGGTLGKASWALIYLAAVVGLMVHVSHGFQSAFQSLGFNHPRWTPRIQVLGYLFSAFVLVGFGAIVAAFALHGAVK